MTAEWIDFKLPSGDAPTTLRFTGRLVADAHDGDPFHAGLWAIRGGGFVVAALCGDADARWWNLCTVRDRDGVPRVIDLVCAGHGAAKQELLGALAALEIEVATTPGNRGES